MKKASSVAIAVAVIMSIILVPFVLLLEFGAGTTMALSNVFQENREDELFAEFEREGGIRFLHREVEQLLSESEKKLGFPDEENLLEGVINYEDVNAIAHGFYNAILDGEKYRFDLSVQKERIKENAESYYDRYIEEQEFPEGADKEYLKNTYLSEVTAQIDEEIADVESDLNSSLSSLYETEEYRKLEQFRTRYGLAGFDEDMTAMECFSELLHTVFLVLFVILIAVVLLLLVSHLFRPSGFYTAGAAAAVSGGLMFLISDVMRRVALPVVFSEYEMLDSGIYAVCEKVLFWLAEGYHRFGIYSISAGTGLIIIGIVFQLFRRKAGAKAGLEI